MSHLYNIIGINLNSSIGRDSSIIIYLVWHNDIHHIYLFRIQIDEISRRCWVRMLKYL